MESDNVGGRRLRFDDFEVDLRSHELLRRGRRVKLQEKSFLVLARLFETPGEVVSREDLAAALWPREHFVDVEQGLNTAVRRLREVLGDSADRPRFVETLPRVGYRFIGTLAAAPTSEPTAPRTTGQGAPDLQWKQPRARPHRLMMIAAGAAAVLAVALIPALRRPRSAPPKPVATSNAAPDSVTELLARGRYLRNVKRFADSRKLVERALTIDPKNGEALAGLGLSLLAEGKDEEARQTARRALEIDASAWEAHRVLGVLARGAGDMAGAEHSFRQAIEIHPSDYKSVNRLARHLLECGKFDEGKRLIAETSKMAPDDPDVQNIRMEYALRTGDYEEAIRQGELWNEIWDVQIRTQPTPIVRDMLGLAYVGARRLDDALRMFRLVDPDDDLRVALALGHAGRRREAVAILDLHAEDVGKDRIPPDPGLAGAFSMAAIASGDIDRAFIALDRQVASGVYPSWLHCALFAPIRADARWPEFERRLEREFFQGRQHATTTARGVLLQPWPRPSSSP